MHNIPEFLCIMKIDHNNTEHFIPYNEAYDAFLDKHDDITLDDCTKLYAKTQTRHQNILWEFFKAGQKYNTHRAQSGGLLPKIDNINAVNFDDVIPVVQGRKGVFSRSERKTPNTIIFSHCDYTEDELTRGIQIMKRFLKQKTHSTF